MPKKISYNVCSSVWLVGTVWRISGSADILWQKLVKFSCCCTILRSSLLGRCLEVIACKYPKTATSKVVILTKNEEKTWLFQEDSLAWHYGQTLMERKTPPFPVFAREHRMPAQSLWGLGSEGVWRFPSSSTHSAAGIAVEGEHTVANSCHAHSQSVSAYIIVNSHIIIIMGKVIRRVSWLNWIKQKKYHQNVPGWFQALCPLHPSNNTLTTPPRRKSIPTHLLEVFPVCPGLIVLGWQDP